MYYLIKNLHVTCVVLSAAGFLLRGTWMLTGSALDYPLAAGRLGYVQVISGRLAVNGVELSAGDGAKIAEESALHFMATDEAEILLFDLPPHQ